MAGDEVKEMERAGRRRGTTETFQGHVRVAAFTRMGEFSVDKCYDLISLVKVTLWWLLG